MQGVKDKFPVLIVKNPWRAPTDHHQSTKYISRDSLRHIMLVSAVTRGFHSSPRAAIFETGVVPKRSLYAMGLFLKRFSSTRSSPHAVDHASPSASSASPSPSSASSASRGYSLLKSLQLREKDNIIPRATSRNHHTGRTPRSRLERRGIMGHHELQAWDGDANNLMCLSVV